MSNVVGSGSPRVGVDARPGLGPFAGSVECGEWTLSSAGPGINWAQLARSHDPICTPATAASEARRPESKWQRRQVHVRYAH